MQHYRVYVFKLRNSSHNVSVYICVRVCIHTDVHMDVCVTSTHTHMHRETSEGLIINQINQIYWEELLAGGESGEKSQDFLWIALNFFIFFKSKLYSCNTCNIFKNRSRQRILKMPKRTKKIIKVPYNPVITFLRWKSDHCTWASNTPTPTG